MTGDQLPSDSNQNLTQRLNIDFALQAAGLGIWEYDPASNQVLWDDRCRALFGLAANNRMSYEQAFAHIHPDDVDRVNQAGQWVMNPESDGVFDQTYRTIGVDDEKLRWVHFQGRVDFTPTGQVHRFAGVAQEVTQQVLSRRELEESALFARSIIDLSPVAKAVFTGPDMVTSIVNARMLELLGQDESMIGKPFPEAIPALDHTKALSVLQQVYQSGELLYQPQEPYSFVKNGAPYQGYYNLTYQPLRDVEGRVYGIINTAVEVTQQVLARQQLEETLSQMRSLVESAPFPIGVYTGRDMRIMLANQSIIDIYGKGPDVIGQSYLELLPELAGQQIFEQLLGVYETGIPFASEIQRVNIEHQGQLVPYYFNYNFTPLFDAQGQVYGVMNTAADVTPLELARQQVEETASALQYTIELAGLGTFSMDVLTGLVTVSSRTADWFGFDSLVADAELFIGGIGETERDAVRTSMNDALVAGSDGRFDVTHSVINAKTGRQIIIRSLGQVYFDTPGQPLRIEGTAQDVTAERELQRVLEQQVQQRTAELATVNEDLAASNEELEASNEEYAVINEELEEANSQLTRSNDNLQTFAYVASHDLQEPLRKIRQFGDLLTAQYRNQLGDGAAYVERMQSAAVRMSTLIKDLLNFSRISTQRDTSTPVSLKKVVGTVLTDLELLIQETGAQIQLGELPTLPGDASQLGQLFQNLLSNALKFRKPGTMPLIRIDTHLINAAELPTSARLVRASGTYFRIDVADNGVGFDEKYLDRIFQVFQRLHGKSEFAGTGIGLAICEKVVTNHGGAITAKSKPGQGATFSVYLPG